MPVTHEMPTVVVLGGGGQLGQAVTDRLARDCRVHSLTHADLDIVDVGAVKAAIERLRPAIVVNCAAFTDVDAAEDRQADAIAVNGVAVGTVARAADAAGATLVHYSTDFVFAGRENRTWTEDDTPEPQSAYAQSKLVGEWLARDCARHYVLRVESLFGGQARRSTIDRMVSALRMGQTVSLFKDRTVTPGFVDDVADATWRLVTSGAPSGLYHCANRGATTWLALGQAIVQRLGLDAMLIRPVSVMEVAMKAPRPQYAALAVEKLAAAGIVMPGWEDALRRYLSRPAA